MHDISKELPLEDESYEEESERYIESKINYIFDTPNYFLGSYFRYYIDTNFNLF